MIKEQFNKAMHYSRKFLFSPDCALNYFRFLASKSKVRVRHSPVNVICYVTDKCNLRCSMCLRNMEKFSDLQHNKIQDMTPDTFKEILNIFKSPASFSFIGQGEPLLNNDVFKMIDLANRMRKETTLFTNGVLLNMEKINMVLNYGLRKINISLYGVDEEEFGSVTGANKAIFHEVIRNIDNLVKQKRKSRSHIKISISYLCTKDNYKNMERIIALGQGLRLDHIYFNNLIPEDILSERGRQKLFFEGDKEIIDTFGSLKQRYKDLRFSLPIVLKRQQHKRYCPFYYRSISVDAAGNVAGCCNILNPHKKYGNIFKDKDIYNGEHFLQTREMFLNRDKDLPLYCKLCPELSR